MPVSDDDLQTLEAYLDDALAWDELDALRARLANEPALGEALAQLRTQRDNRKAALADLEPVDADVTRLIASVNKEVRKDVLRTRAMGAMRWVGSAAALLVVGFTMGRMSSPQSNFTQNPIGPATSVQTRLAESDSQAGQLEFISNVKPEDLNIVPGDRRGSSKDVMFIDHQY